jgi:hypothetical protein
VLESFLSIKNEANSGQNGRINTCKLSKGQKGLEIRQLG